jgi:VWFA-related protein
MLTLPAAARRVRHLGRLNPQRLISASFCAALLCLTLPLFAQQSSPSPSASAPSAAPALIPRTQAERVQDYLNEHRIILNVLVTDASGRPVTGLTQDDFRLRQDQQPLEIATFRPAVGDTPIAPAHIILLLDMVDSPPRSTLYERKEIEKFLGRNQAHLTYPTSVAVFTGYGIKSSLPSQDGSLLIGEFRSLVADVRAFECAPHDLGPDQEMAAAIYGPSYLSTAQSGAAAQHAASCLNQRFQLALTSLNRLALRQSDVPGRVILVWIGPGWPQLSGTQFRPDSASIRSGFFRYLVDLSTALREGQVTLDAVSEHGIFETAEALGAHDQSFIDGTPSANQVTAASLSLPVLAHQSGGQVLERNKSVADDIAACIADAQSYYALSFDSAPTAQPNEYHSLHVEVDRPGLSVRTSTVYYAQP